MIKLEAIQANRSLLFKRIYCTVIAMPGEYMGRPEERRRIDYEKIDLSEGPVDLLLSDHLIRIVDPRRDLGESWNVEYLIVDPAAYDKNSEQGYKGLRDDETIILGRESTYGRFRFSDYVSRAHIKITRKGDVVEIQDLSSTNGTYRLFPVQGIESYGFEDEDTLPETARLPQIAGYSTASERHPNENQDAYFVNMANFSMGAFDGVSGDEGSAIAAEIASQSVDEYLEKTSSQLPKSLAQLSVYEALWAGHEGILEQSPNKTIATTATVAKVFETQDGKPYVVVGSVGDSRAYLFRNGNIEFLTLDHAYMPGMDKNTAKTMQDTLAGATDLSQLDEEARAAFRNRNIITSSLGVGEKPPVITISSYDILPGDKLMLTTDGVHDNLTTSELCQLLGLEESADTHVERIVLEALRRSRDRNHLRAKPDDMTATILIY